MIFQFYSDHKMLCSAHVDEQPLRGQKHFSHAIRYFQRVTARRHVCRFVRNGWLSSSWPIIEMWLSVHTDPPLKFVYYTAISPVVEGLIIDYSYLTKYLNHRDILGASNLSQKQVYSYNRRWGYKSTAPAIETLQAVHKLQRKNCIRRYHQLSSMMLM